MMQKTTNRNSGLERIRVIACFLVIMNHIQGAPVVENGFFFKGRECLIVLTQTCVQLFLMISGFSMFRNTEKNLDELWELYWRRLKKFILYIFVPSFIIVIISAVFYSFIVEGKTISDVFLERNFQWIYIKDYIFLQQSDYICVHLWYVWEYAKIIVFFPFLAFICQNNKDKNRIRRMYMLASAINVIFVDAQNFAGVVKGNFDNLTINKYFLYVLIGYELYLVFSKPEINRKKIRMIGVALLGVALVSDILLQSSYFKRTGGTFLLSTIIGLAAIGNFMFLLSLKEPKFPQIWRWLGKRTLYVYFVHVIVIFTGENVWGRFFWEIAGAGKNSLSLIGYSLIYTTLIFGLSVVVGGLFSFVYEKVFLSIGKKILVKINNGRKESDGKSKIVGNTDTE